MSTHDAKRPIVPTDLLGAVNDWYEEYDQGPRDQLPIRETRRLVEVLVQVIVDQSARIKVLEEELAPTTPRWVIEFRSGRFFQNLEAEHGGPASSAQRFLTRDAASRLIEQHDWMTFNGAMPVRLPDAGEGT